MRTLVVVMLTALLVTLSPVLGSAQEKKSAGEPKSAPRNAQQDPAAGRAPCDAQCRHDHEGNAAAIQACIRGCGAGGPAGSRSNLNSSKSN